MKKRKTKRKIRPQPQGSAVDHGILTEIDWLLLSIAVLGLVVTSVLLWGAFNSVALPYCGVSSGCDVIQSSGWSLFLGIPLAAWGAVTYAILSVCALHLFDISITAKISAFFSSAGFLISCYLTLVGYFYLNAFCQYCLISLILVTAAFIVVLKNNERRSRRQFYFGGTAAMLVIILMHSMNSNTSIFGPREDPELTALAMHLSEKAFKFYGASWCNHCQEQKRLFGKSSEYLPYVECSKYGPNGPTTTECQLQEIRNYPTWIVNGKRFEYVLPVDRLKRLSGFTSSQSGELKK